MKITFIGMGTMGAPMALNLLKAGHKVTVHNRTRNKEEAVAAAGARRAASPAEAAEGAEVVTFADLEPQSLTLDEAGENADFEFLTPTETPPGATLVDILEVRGALVHRYTLPEGGSFTIAQGIFDQTFDQSESQSSESQPVEVRGTTGQLLEAEDGGQVLLAWTEGELFYSVAGDLTFEQALTIAESLQ